MMSGAGALKSSADALNGARPLLIARTYAELTDGIAMRLAELNVAHLSVDRSAGLATGHTSKLLSFTKRYGAITLDLHLETLGLCLIIAEDPIRPPRIGNETRKFKFPPNSLKSSDASSRLAMRRLSREPDIVLRKFLRKIAKKGRGNISAGIRKRVSSARRRANARKAANARWHPD